MELAMMLAPFSYQATPGEPWRISLDFSTQQDLRGQQWPLFIWLAKGSGLQKQFYSFSANPHCFEL
jgi:hypothetical protein